MEKASSTLPLLAAASVPLVKNMFCRRAHLTNEASVEKLFVDRLLDHLGYTDADLTLKTSIRELKVGTGSSSSLYKPDYVIKANSFPALVIDAKAPSEDVEKWVKQCRSYCLELNTMFEHNPVNYYVLSNGLRTTLYKWDRAKPLVELAFDDFLPGNRKLAELQSYVAKSAIRDLSREKHDELRESDFEFGPVSLDKISSIFLKLHDYMREKEKKTPPAAFMELMKIIFVKIKKIANSASGLAVGRPRSRTWSFPSHGYKSKRKTKAQSMTPCSSL